MDEFHRRQRELGACRCKDCMASYSRKPATLTWDFGGPDMELVAKEHGLSPEVLERGIDAVLGAFDRATDAEIEEEYQRMKASVRIEVQQRLEKIDRDVGALAEDVSRLVAELKADASKE